MLRLSIGLCLAKHLRTHPATPHESQINIHAPLAVGAGLRPARPFLFDCLPFVVGALFVYPTPLKGCALFALRTPPHPSTSTRAQLTRCVYELPVVVTPVDLFPHNREVALRRTQRIGLPRKSDGRHFHVRLQLARGSSPSEPKVLGRVFILHRLSR